MVLCAGIAGLTAVGDVVVGRMGRVGTLVVSAIKFGNLVPGLVSSDVMGGVVSLVGLWWLTRFIPVT